MDGAHLGVLSSLIFLLSRIGSLGEARMAPLPAMDWVERTLHGAPPVGVVPAFRREGVGSAAILLGFLAPVALQPRYFGVPSLLLYAPPGALFGLCWLAGKRQHRPV